MYGCKNDKSRNSTDSQVGPLGSPVMAIFRTDVTNEILVKNSIPKVHIYFIPQYSMLTKLQSIPL